MNSRTAFLASLFIVAAFMRAGAVAAQAETPASPAASSKGVIVVLIYDESCKETCEVVRPIVRELTQQQASNVDYVELNTAKANISKALQQAKDLNIRSFVDDRTDEVPVVGLFARKGSKPKLLKELVGKKNRQVYQANLEKALQSK